MYTLCKNLPPGEKATNAANFSAKTTSRVP